MPSTFDDNYLWHNDFSGSGAYDDYETNLAKYCYDHDIPTLGICCGQNALIRALGGTTKTLPNPEKHNQPTAKYVHDIAIDPSSKFYQIVGEKTLKVNSRHKRSIATAPGLNTVAFDDDGNIEIIEAPDKKFYIGMRFHPESLYKSDPHMRAIFTAFLEACQN